MIRPPSAAAGGRSHDHRGQATVEVALALPLLAVLALALVQLGVVAARQLAVVEAARAAARAAAVGSDAGGVRAAATAAAPGVNGRELTVTVRSEGDTVTADVRVVVHPDIPVVRPFVPDLELSAHETMEKESDKP